jgi:hypothetical protein
MLGSIALYGVMLGLTVITPPPRAFIQDFFHNPITYYRIFDRLVPKGAWFAGLFS